MFACPATDDFFRSRIDHMIDLRHPLAVLASRMPWQEIEARVAQVFSRKGRAGVAMPDLDLFGEQAQRAAVASNAGRPRVPLRIMIALLYLKHAFNESDEGVVARWSDTPRWQFFSGCAYYEDRQPCDATKRISEQERKQLRRRQAIEPIIGHLKGETGDRLHAVLCAAGYNIRWLLRMIARKGITFVRRLYLRLCTVAGVSPNWVLALLRLWPMSASRAASTAVSARNE